MASSEKIFACNHCSKSYEIKRNLVSHMRKIHQEKPYKCELCSESYFMRNDLVQHRNKSHLGEYVCNICFN